MLKKRFWSKRRSLEVDTYLTCAVLRVTGKVNVDIPKSNKLQNVFQISVSIAYVINICESTSVSGRAMLPRGVYYEMFPADRGLATFGPGVSPCVDHSCSFSLSLSGEFQPTKSGDELLSLLFAAAHSPRLQHWARQGDPGHHTLSAEASPRL